MNRAWVGDAGAGSSAGARPDEARRHNRAALLRRLHVDGPCTRAVLAAVVAGAVAAAITYKALRA